MKIKMKKSYQLACALVLSLAVFVACSEDHTETNEIQQENNNELLLAKGNGSGIESQVKLLQSTDKMTRRFFEMGIKKIVVNDMGAEVNYSFDTDHGFQLNTDYVDFASKKFVLKNDMFYEFGDPNTFLKAVNGVIHLKTPNYSGPVKDYTGTSVSKVASLIFVLNELVADPSNTIAYPTQVAATAARGCSFWNTVYVFGFGFSQSAAAANLEYAMDHLTIVTPACRKLNKTPELHEWFGSGYTYTNTYCCD